MDVDVSLRYSLGAATCIQLYNNKKQVNKLIFEWHLIRKKEYVYKNTVHNNHSDEERRGSISIEIGLLDVKFISS